MRTRRVKQSRRGAFSLDCRARSTERLACNDGVTGAMTREPSSLRGAWRASSLRTRRVKQSRLGAFSLDCRARSTERLARNDGVTGAMTTAPARNLSLPKPGPHPALSLGGIDNSQAVMHR
ncbi:MAG: hypothetical protein LBT00_07085 [Spirochaetaceae bacterium]|nr:hypothetical protein [Spirochaetaceae bacterium]